jgi:RNA polymerase sigma factor (sigma-70 family)
VADEGQLPDNWNVFHRRLFMSPIQLKNIFSSDLGARLRRLGENVQDPSLGRLADEFEFLLGEEPGSSDSGPTVPEVQSGRATKEVIENFRDRLSTRLMDAYRVSGDPAAFGLLYEVNSRLFLNIISARLRKFYFSLDPQDVLQEVFFNIYRYPHKFNADKETAFRHWASMIIRNTVYKHTRQKGRELLHESPEEEIDGRADARGLSPLNRAINEESRSFCQKAFLLYLQLYLAAYEQLSSREQRALYLVEIEDKPYKQSAEELGIRLENLKMVIFRARKKIHRALDRAMALVSTTESSWEGAPVGRTPSRDRSG